MKAIITQADDITPDLQQTYHYQICADDDAVLLQDAEITCRPSEARSQIETAVVAFDAEYEKSQELTVGTEI